MIFLFLLLLTAGTVEAGDLEKVKPGDTIVFMPGTYDKDHPLTLAPKEFQCYRRMQEAMKAADAYLLNPAPYMPPKTVEEREERYRIRKQVGEQWDQTMKDCVR